MPSICPIRSLAIACLLLWAAGLSAQMPAGRRHLNFDRDWKFHFGHAGDPTRDFQFSIANIFAKSGRAEQTAIDPKFADSSWQTVHLPHDWAVGLPFVYSPNFDVMAHGYKPVGGLFPETSIGWYRKQFEVAAADSMRRFSLQFDGIFRDSRVWVNGFYLGRNESGYLGLSYDISDYLHYGGQNTVVVRVDASQYEGWFYEGAGIYRHVWLNSYAPLHFADPGLFIHQKIGADRTTSIVEYRVENQSAQAREYEVQHVIVDREGRRIDSISHTYQLAAAESRNEISRLSILQPRLWSLQDPYLYRLISVIRCEGKPVDSLLTRFGVRSIEIDAQKGFSLNGKPLKLLGVNCHQDHAGLGSALPDEMQYYRIRLLKEMGVNAYRTSHNAPTPELLEACDSLGMLVMDENRLLNSSPEYLDQLERLILRDRNHPSIFLWSIGNEEGVVQANSTGLRIASTLIQRQQQLDPTRTCTYAADLANVHQGINEVIPVRGFNYRIDGIGPYHLDHPHQPILGTEMGSTVTTRGIYVKDSTRAYVPDQDITYPWWANTAEQWWKPAAERDWYLGGFIWTGFDYRGEPTPYAWPNINSHFGVMDMCGYPKNIYYYYQSWWTDRDVLHISPHWNWPGEEGQVKEVWINSNADAVELLLNGRSLGRKTMPRNSHLKWQVPYKAGKLEAIGWRKGRKIRAAVETTGPAVALRASSEKTHLPADHTAIAIVDLIAVDAKGREVPDANLPMHFEISGPGQILGMGNGDPSSHEADQCPQGPCHRSLFNGKAQVILQAGGEKGKLLLRARAEGLQDTQVEIQIQ